MQKAVLTINAAFLCIRFKMKVLYEDKHLIVVNKEYGITTQENKSNEKCLLDMIREERNSDNMYLALINRLATRKSNKKRVYCSCQRYS